MTECQSLEKSYISTMDTLRALQELGIENDTYHALMSDLYLGFIELSYELRNVLERNQELLSTVEALMQRIEEEVPETCS